MTDRLSRREFLRQTAILAAAPALAPLAFAAAGSAEPAVGHEQAHFFTAPEAAFVAAATARLIPSDATGPGAQEAGVTDFIDRQLAGPFGRAADWYMQGPFAEGTPEQGYQSRRTPADLYRAAIHAIDGHCASQFEGKSFAALAPDEQDALLKQLESGEIDLRDVPVKTFFSMLLDNTKEGYFSDPIHGGNRDMASWKMIGFPGARADYTDFVDRYNEPYPLPPIGIAGNRS
jgi:gluconate 2-dehydrogenase gamma chain